MQYHFVLKQMALLGNVVLGIMLNYQKKGPWHFILQAEEQKEEDLAYSVRESEVAKAPLDQI